jgi:hypothetical protein
VRGEQHLPGLEVEVRGSPIEVRHLLRTEGLQDFYRRQETDTCLF